MATRGGKRANSGRKKSALTKRTQAIAENLTKTGSGITPLEYMLDILRDDTADAKDRFAAAMAAAPYIHPRLAAVEHSGNQEKPLSMLLGLLGEIDGKTRGLPKGR